MRHPVAFGMPTRWPVFFRHDQAYRLKPSFDVRTDVVSKYPDEEDLIASGWLLGGELLRDQANVIAFELGRGSVVALGSQVEFRTQTEATFKLLFNALVQGPADELTASELARLRSPSPGPLARISFACSSVKGVGRETRGKSQKTTVFSVFLAFRACGIEGTRLK